MLREPKQSSKAVARTRNLDAQYTAKGLGLGIRQTNTGQLKNCQQRGPCVAALEVQHATQHIRRNMRHMWNRNTSN